ncbi:MAG: hypothetical protein ABI166_09115 [Mucilaginibacter sp.]
MKQKLLTCLLFILPFLAIAQDEAPPLITDFYQGAKEMPESFILNDHVNIMEFKNDNEDYNIIAVDDQMQTLWNTPIQGDVISASKFKDKVLIVTSTEFSKIKSNNNTFKAYLLDPANGKVLIEKVIFDGPQDYLVFPFVFTGDGNIFKFAVRQSSFERRLHVGLPGLFALISLDRYYKELRDTKDFDVIDFDEHLEPITKIKPVKNVGTFLDMTANNHGDLFINWFNDGNMNIVKYEAGKGTPASQLSCAVTIDEGVLHNFENHILISPSKKNYNVLYYALMFKNSDKEMELGIGKLDYSTGKSVYANELLTKDNIKELKKSFVPVNKKMDSPDLGYIKGMNVRTLTEVGDRVIVTITSRSTVSGNYSVSELEYNILINAYDTDLKLKYQQLVPTSYACLNRLLPMGYYHDSDKFYVLSNDKHGINTFRGTYSVFNLETGECEKMYWLTKKYIANYDLVGGSSALWFKNSFVVPYLHVKGMAGAKFDVTLQQNSY